MENLIKNHKGNDIPKIDLHTHYLPEAFVQSLLKDEGINPHGFPIPQWNPELHLDAMKDLGISTSMLSIPYLGDNVDNKSLARRVNETAAELVKKYHGKFGLIASLPLPDVKDSIEEIRYAAEVLNADGFTVPTNANGIYLGNPCLDQVFQELDKRKAVVILHPNKPGSVPGNVAEELPMPAMEYLFDTTRTVINMILKGTLKRFPNIKFVIPHAGAFLTILADRIAFGTQMMPGSDEKDRLDICGELKTLYYDVAGVCLPIQLEALLKIVDIDHLLYGSDYPYTPKPACIELADALDKTNLLTDEERRAIYHDNAFKLFHI